MTHLIIPIIDLVLHLLFSSVRFAPLDNQQSLNIDLSSYQGHCLFKFNLLEGSGNYNDITDNSLIRQFPKVMVFP